MFRPAFLVIAITTLGLASCGGGDSSLTIDNQSSYSLFEIHVAQVDDPNWGPNLLGSDPLDPGESLVITSIDCDTYDVDIIDDTGAECILQSLDLCFDDAVWSLDDIDLASCAF